MVDSLRIWPVRLVDISGGSVFSPSVQITADDQAAPTAPEVYAYLMGRSADGADNWDRVKLMTGFDLDQSGNTQLVLGSNLRISGPTGSIEVGTVASPLQVSLQGHSSNTTPVLVQGFNSAGLTFRTAQKVLFSAVTGSFVYTSFIGGVYVEGMNNLNQPIEIGFSTSASTPPANTHKYLEAAESFAWDFGSDGYTATGYFVWIKHSGVAPTAGSLRLAGFL